MGARSAFVVEQVTFSKAAGDGFAFNQPGGHGSPTGSYKSRIIAALVLMTVRKVIISTNQKNP